ncbi:MAG: YcfL family protein [Deltaproteobacteria bacterium]|nr:YcfL family protein [Deltaproteobacteria bacterium]
MGKLGVIFVRTLIVFMLLVAAGCVSAPAEVTGKKGWDDKGAPTLRYNDTFGASNMRGKLEVISAQREIVGDIMRVDIALRSQLSRPISVQYKFEWFDADGIQIMSASSWTPITFYDLETKKIVGVAPNKRVDGFSLKVLPVK